MVRFALVGWLCVGVALGPNLCCCALASTAAPAKAAPQATGCCCCTPAEEADDDPSPTAPDDHGSCPCKQKDRRSVSLPPATVGAAAAGEWFELVAAFLPSLGPGVSALLEPQLAPPLDLACSHGPAARGRCPILRC